MVITGKFFGTLNFDNNVTLSCSLLPNLPDTLQLECLMGVVQVRLVSGTGCRVRAGTGRVCEHSVYIAKFQYATSAMYAWVAEASDPCGDRRQNGEFVWADKISDPVHMKANTGSVTFDNTDGGATTMTVKNEFKIWANRSATLYHRLDDVDIERCVSALRVIDCCVSKACAHHFVKCSMLPHIFG